MSEELPSQLDGVDLDDGLKRVAGNRKLLRKLLLKFRASNQETPAEIRGALAQGDLELAQRLAHTVKGVAGNIGATDVHHAAAAVDAALKEQDQAKIDETLPKLESEMNRLFAAVGEMESGGAVGASPGARSGVDAGVVKPLLDRLEVLLAADDFGSQAAADEARQALGGGAAELAFGPVSEAIGGYDFEEALEKLRSFRSSSGL